MKKILGIAALSMGVMLTSCSDFLDQKSPSDHDQEGVFNSVIGLVLKSTRYMAILHKTTCIPIV